MKKIISILFISVFLLFSCGSKTKFQDLPIEKQETIVKEVYEKIQNGISSIDMSSYTNQANLTEDNLKKLSEQMDKVVDSAIEDLKKSNKDIDFSVLEERLKNEDFKSM
ncbi:hypothetical protein DLH72_02505 [Candidatus Gracilibacteria bacterium]|nr:MAG: hypothetical protein DLH72_02505 [Candidatus Gracilibacteria bacterium]